MERKDVPASCPFCGQPLVDEAAVRRLRRHEAELKEQYAAEATTAVEQRLTVERARLEQQIRSEQAQQEKARERMMAALRQRNDELERRLQKLSANERGDSQEIDILDRLRQAFANDCIEPRGRSGDIVQIVRYGADGSLQEAGTIIYECKDTLRWSGDFVTQTKKAGREHGSPYTVLVTRAFPAGEKDLCVRDNVIVVHPSKAVILAEMVRRMVIEIHRAELTAEGRSDKTSRLYEYLAGDEFRSTFDAIAAASGDLNKILHEEKQAHERIWGRRAQAYGDLGRRTAAVEGAIRGILEATSAPQAKVIRFPVPGEPKNEIKTGSARRSGPSR